MGFPLTLMLFKNEVYLSPCDIATADFTSISLHEMSRSLIVDLINTSDRMQMGGDFFYS